MSGHEWEIGLLVIGAVIAGLVRTIFARAEKSGERMGRLEKWVDREEGRRLGIAEETQRRDAR